MFKKILEHVGVGLAIGSVISTACIAIFNGMDGTIVQVIAWLCASVMFGLVSLIYDIDALPQPLAIGLHALLCCGIAVGTGYLLGYGDHLGSMLAMMLPLFIIVYLLICTGVWLYGRYCARITSERLAGDKK